MKINTRPLPVLEKGLNICILIMKKAETAIIF